MMRQTREAMVRTMGVKMQAKRPSLPILAVDQAIQGTVVRVKLMDVMGLEGCNQVDLQNE